VTAPRSKIFGVDGRTWLWGSAAALPLLFWWLGWYPGILSSDSVDQLGQAENFEFFNHHPAIHSLYLWLLRPAWSSPGTISLFQALAMGGLLGLAAMRLAQLGVPAKVAIGTAWAISLLPAIAPTTLTIWKDVPFTFALLWAFTELLVMARDPGRFWARRWGPARLGMALGLVWVTRHNGFITVVILLVALGFGFRSQLKRVGVAAAIVVAIVVGVQVVLYRVLPVDRGAIEPSATFISDVAASFHHEPSNFTQADLRQLGTIAPLEVWDNQYSCTDSTALSFDPRFDSGQIDREPGAFRSLVVRAILRDLDTVAGHRWCAANYLLIPGQPADAYFQRPPYSIPDNPYPRSPISDTAFEITDRIFRWAEGPLWLTWRPALAIWAALATYAAIAYRRRLRVLLWPGGLILAHIINVAATTPAQEFRYAFGIYVMALLSLPLLFLVANPLEASLVPAVVDNGSD